MQRSTANPLSRTLHSLFGGLSPTDALSRARTAVNHVGGCWREPVIVKGGWYAYHVLTGMKWGDADPDLHVLIRRRDGVVLKTEVWTADGWQPISGCTHCGYDVTGNTSGRCPECGSQVNLSNFKWGRRLSALLGALGDAVMPIERSLICELVSAGKPRVAFERLGEMLSARRHLVDADVRVMIEKIGEDMQADGTSWKWVQAK